MVPFGMACQAIGSDEPRNLGSTDSLLVQVPAPDAPFVTDIESFQGRWVGVAEDPLALGAGVEGTSDPYRFPSGSNQIVLELSYTDSIFGGTLTFGEGSIPAPPTDPDVGYPEGVSYAELLRYPVTEPLQFDGDLAFDRGVLPPHEGFPYELIRPDASPDAPAADGLLRMTYVTTRVLQDWCALQTPYETPQGTFSCNEGVALADLENGGCRMIEHWAFPTCDATTGECEPLEPIVEIGPVDCDRAFLCGDEAERCKCTEDGCWAGSVLAEITLRASGDELIGLISNATFLNERHARAPLGRIVFHRSEP
jgi:hypothetical protein